MVMLRLAFGVLLFLAAWTTAHFFVAAKHEQQRGEANFDQGMDNQGYVHF